MLDEVQAFSKIKDKSINDNIKTTKFLFLCNRELGESLWMAVIRKDLNFQDNYHK